MSKLEDDILTQVARIADALERRYPGNMTPDSLPAAAAYVWQSDIRQLVPVSKVNGLDISLLKGIDDQRDSLLSNTIGFVQGFPANNALLWGRVAPANPRLSSRCMVA